MFGVPKPAGSKRGFATKNGRVIVTEDNSTVATWRDDVMIAALRAKGDNPTITGPVSLELRFYLPRPKNRPKTRRVLPITKPDLDKIVRSTSDSLVDSGIIADDAQVVRLLNSKVYAVTPDLKAIYNPDIDRAPGAVIIITTITEDT